jgi:SAM-dependent methyltransferase
MDLWDAWSGMDVAIWYLIRDIIRPHSDDRVLELGCGTGRILERLPPVRFYIGVDTNAHHIRSAQRRYPHGGQFICSKLTVPPRMGQKFTLVLALGLLHRLSDPEAHQVIRSAHAMLAPRGRFITFDPLSQPSASWLGRLWQNRLDGPHLRDQTHHLALFNAEFPHIAAYGENRLARIPSGNIIVEANAWNDPRPIEPHYFSPSPRKEENFPHQAPAFSSGREWPRPDPAPGSRLDPLL